MDWRTIAMLVAMSLAVWTQYHAVEAQKLALQDTRHAVSVLEAIAEALDLPSCEKKTP